MIRKGKMVGEGGQGSQIPAPSPRDSTSPALINPEREVGEEAVAARVVMVCTRPDYQLLSRLVGAKQPPRHFWNCAVRSGIWTRRGITVAGPALGAPYAAMVLEKLIALGVKAVVVLGWCGSLSPSAKIGSLVLPLMAVGGDGTSPHYRLDDHDLLPHAGLSRSLQHLLSAGSDAGVPWQAGPVWTTDAFYRETVEAVRRYQSQGVLAVDLEMAALYAVGRFRGVAVAGLLAVSDELFTLTWRPGQRSGRLRQAREVAARAALTALAAWEEDDA
jgi:uridine phosphorylase